MLAKFWPSWIVLQNVFKECFIYLFNLSLYPIKYTLSLYVCILVSSHTLLIFEGIFDFSVIIQIKVSAKKPGYLMINLQTVIGKSYTKRTLFVYLQRTRCSWRWLFCFSNFSIWFSIWSWLFFIASCCSVSADKCRAWKAPKAESENSHTEFCARVMINLLCMYVTVSSFP